MEAGRPVGSVALAKEARPAQRDGGVASPARAKARWFPTWAAFALGAAAIATVVFLALRPAAEPSSVSAAAQPPTDLAAKSAAKSVAVLPFENLSGDKDNEYFSHGISEELINVLGKVSGLNVAGRTSSFFFKGKQVPPAEMAQKLGVNYLVSGSVQEVGTQVRIRAQLIKAADGYQLWSSEPLTRDLKDIFAVQDEIAGLIAQNLKLNLGYSPRVAAVVNPEAHRLVLEARFFWAQRTEEGFAKAEKACVRALRSTLSSARRMRGWPTAGRCAVGWGV